jgi:hypothetical protein
VGLFAADVDLEVALQAEAGAVNGAVEERCHIGQWRSGTGARKGENRQQHRNKAKLLD